MDYNEQQQSAITAPLGRMALVAGPGTGKTATIVGRIIYVIQHYAILADKVLAITFTRKAAAELRRRLRDSLPTVPAAMTIHALAVLILRRAQPDFVVDPAAFDDLVPAALTLMRTNRQLCVELQGQWQYIVVDEFQDVDVAQVELIELLGARHGNICIVGDPNQSIYSFRGAVPEALYQFCTPATLQLQLITHYRSQANIVRVGQAVLQTNASTSEVVLLQPVRPATAIVECTVTANASGEAHQVIKQITTLVGASDHLALARNTSTPATPTSYTFSDIAVMYRLNSIGDQFERYLCEAGLPFRRVGAKTIFTQPAVAAFLADLPDIFLDDKQTLAQQLPKEFAGESFDDFRLVVESFNDLSAAAARGALLDHVVLAQPEDDHTANHNTITLLTAHAAKGLEFPVVFVIGAEDGLFPNTEKVDCNLAEERRLFYVAVTRAKDRLYLLAARRRTLYGQSMERATSQFITNLPPALVQTVVSQSQRRPQQTRLF